MVIKIIKIFIFIVMISFLRANYCYAQEIMPSQPEKTNKSPKIIENVEKPISPEILKPDEKTEKKTPYNIEDFLKQNKPPEEVPRDKPPERSKDANPDKPDICGSIIFDLTEKEQPISLKDTLEIAMEKNFDIKIFGQKVEKNKWDYYGRIANFLPDIDGTQIVQKNIGNFVVSGIIPDSTRETAYQTNFDFYYFISIRKYFNLQIARNEYKAEKKNFEFTKNEILKDSATKYYELLQSKIRIEILETNLKQIKEQLRINKQKQEAGIGTKFDVLRAEANLASANQELTLAQNQYRFNQAQLSNVIGIPVFIQLVPDDKDIKIKEIFKDCFDLDKAKGIAMSARPDLQAAKFDIETARQKRNLSYSNYLPDIALYGQVSRQGVVNAASGNNKIFGVAAGWNLANRVYSDIDFPVGLGMGVIGYTDIKSKKAQLEESKLTYVKKSRDIEEKLVGNFFDIIAARSIIDSTWAEVQASAEARNISVIKLKAGLGTFIDVLQTQFDFTSARIKHLESVTGYNIQQVELLFDMGIISVNNILEGFNSDNSKTTK